MLSMIALSVSLLIGCKSREERALETIRDAMFKTLPDFESYEPVETTIDSLKNDRYGDTLVTKLVLKMRLMDGVIEEFDKDYKEAKRIFNIWDDPRMYHYSSFALNKRNNAYNEMRTALIGKEATENVRDSYLDTLLILEQNHTGELYGWRVHHKFRCKTKDGGPTLCDYVYFMDKKCETILWRFDEDEMSWKCYVWYIDDAYQEAKDRAERVEVDTVMVD